MFQGRLSKHSTMLVVFDICSMWEKEQRITNVSSKNKAPLVIKYFLFANYSNKDGNI